MHERGNRNMTFCVRKAVYLAALIISLSCVNDAWAFSWTNGSGGGNWNVGSNWDAGRAPNSGDVIHVGNFANDVATITAPGAAAAYIWLAYNNNGTINMQTGSTLTVGQITMGTPNDGPLSAASKTGTINLYGTASITAVGGGSQVIQVGSKGNGSLNLYGTSNVTCGWQLQVGANYGQGLGRVTLNDNSWIKAELAIIPNQNLGQANPNSGIDIRDMAEIRATGGNIAGYITSGKITGNGLVGNVATQVIPGIGGYTRIFVPGSKAVTPVPATDASGIDPSAILSWTAGTPAPTTGHDVYFGTSLADVETATVAVHPNVTYIRQSGTTYDPDVDGFGDMNWNTTYYWRIDEVSGSSIVKGDVWNFRTMAFYCDPPLAGDLNGDCKVNIEDLAMAVGNWLVCTAPRQHLCP
jgi:hypothetical protein